MRQEVSELRPSSAAPAARRDQPGVSDDQLRRAVDGKIVLITGASSGVGEASALRLAAAGATVLLVARRPSCSSSSRDQIAARRRQRVRAPVRHGATPTRVGELARRACSSSTATSTSSSTTPALSIRRWIAESYDRFHDFERTINVNYLGPVRLLLGLLPSMRERGSGHIVNVATMGVDFPPLRWSAYIASKSAFEVWLGGVAPEIRADGVTVTSIHLQLVRSPMLGPFRMWRYVPGMSTDEAAGMVARAIAMRPRTIAPVWARLGGPVTRSRRRRRAAFARQARRPIPRSRPPAPTPTLGVPASRAARRSGARRRSLRSASSGRSAPTASAARCSPQRRFGATPGVRSPRPPPSSTATARDDRRARHDHASRSSTPRRARSPVRSTATSTARATQRVAIMCRNHRGFVHAAAAASRLGCDLVPLNTDFAGPQLGDVLAREGVTAAIYDEEFESVFDASGFDGHPDRRVARPAQAERPTLDALIAAARPTPRRPARPAA